MKFQLLSLFVIIALLSGCSFFSGREKEKSESVNNPFVDPEKTPSPAPAPMEIKSLSDQLSEFVAENTANYYDQLFPPRTKIEKVEVSEETVKIVFSGELADYPLRPATVTTIDERLRPVVSKEHPGVSLEFFIGDKSIWEYIPPIYREQKDLAMQASKPSTPPWVDRVSCANPAPEAGLYGRYICLWGSHGWYYANKGSKRWEWQRPRMFTIVEDMFPTSYMIPFILPMLENAGAVTSYLRERDYQVNEVLVDDGDEKSNPERGVFQTNPQGSWKMSDEPGFKSGLAPYPDGTNPHEKGAHTISSDPASRAAWIPNIPEDGRYAVYVSYNMSPERSTRARYTVRHLGGETDFHVNQQMGGNTWVYLGHFLFAKGSNPEKGSVQIHGPEEEDATVSADCVKFGGGMGDYMRDGRTSGYPRYCEAARYWLQYAGVNPDLVYKLGFKGEPSDYTEDYVSRAEYANYLKGDPYGPNVNRTFPGLNVPVDLAFGFHTDAGIKDGIVGTLSIYTVNDEEKKQTFPDGDSRLDANRMFADLIQTQIVNDLRAKFSSTWTRRQLWNRSYSESRRGNMPSSLLELLSHQNFHDMKYGIDPRFKFTVSRAIYKAMLRFIAFKNGYEPVIQPLAPRHLSVKRQSENSAIVSWKPQPDSLEPTAMPDGYIVYTREGDDEFQYGFDNGVKAEGTSFVAENLNPETIYSFKVTAYNAGGESFPSETLCVKTGNGDSGKRGLIVNAFDRICAPSTIIEENHSGFDRVDRGVGYMANYGLTGDTWDYDPESKFRTNDAPGHGASHGNLETKMELGNTFDFTIRHGAAMKEAGWGFDSASDEAVREGAFELTGYDFIDWLLGEERTTMPPRDLEGEGAPDQMQPQFRALPPEDQRIISTYLTGGGALFLSGAYVGTDLAGEEFSSEQDKKFLEETLKIYWTTNHGSRTNDIMAAPPGPFSGLPDMHISSGIGEDGIYGVELPDSIKPAVAPRDTENFQTSECILRFKDNRWSAGIAMKKPSKIVVLGFPFECITTSQHRAEMMRKILEYLGN